MSPTARNRELSLLFVLISAAALSAQPCRVVDIRIVGNKHISGEAVLGVLTTQIGDDLVTETLTADKQRLMDMGFFHDVDTRIERRADGCVVVIEVWENPVIKSVRLVGNKSMDTDQLMEVIRTKPGAVLNDKQLDDDADQIAQLYRGAGYLGHVIDAKLEKDGVLTLIIQEDTIQDIHFVGLKKTREYVLLREMDVKPGDVFNAKKLHADLNRIFDLNILEDIKYERVRGDGLGKWVINVTVKEKKTGTAALGVGFSSRSQLVGFANLEESNFRGRAQRVALRVEFGDRKSWDASYFEPWWDSKHTSVGINVFNRLIYREPTGGFFAGSTGDFDERRKGARITIGRPLSRTMAWNARIKDEFVDFRNTTVVGLPFADTQGRVVSLTGSLIHDTRDLKLDTSTGGRESISLEVAGSILGGDFPFTKVDLDLRRYRPLFNKQKKLIGAARLLYGHTFGTLPSFEQYFLGGSENLRGYNIDRTFGDSMALLNLELRYRLQKNLQAILFIDYGDAWGGSFAEHQDFDPLLGYGVGLRVNSPVGPIRLDFGIGEDGSRTHFSIGQMF